MIDTHKIYNALKANFSAEQAEALTNIISETILDFDRLVTKQELGELKEAIKELSEAQRRTEERLNALAEAQRRTEERVNELAEAQRRTEERLNALAEAQRRTEERLNALAEAQRRTEERLNALAEAQRRTEERVNELAEAQRRTEERVNELAEAQRRTEERVNELAEAQRRTEERVNELAEAQRRTEERVNELAEAQRRTEERLNELAEAQRRTEERLNALAEAQRRTEERVNELAEAQRRTEERLNELAEAQRRTEERLDKLAHEMTEMRREFYAEIKDIRQQLGGLSMAVGYGIEDRIMPYFYDLAEKDYGITLKSLDRRNYIYPDGRYDEVNIYAEGVKGDRVCLIIAECKAQPGKKDVDRFSDMLSRLRAATGLEVYPILIGYVFSPEVEMYVQTQYPEIRLMKTFEFELSYDARKKRRA